MGRPAVLAVLVFACVASGAVPAHARARAQTPDADTITRAVMNEAEGENYQSKLAHAFLFLNRARRGMALGSSGLDSPKVRARLARANAGAWRDARRAVECARDRCVPDPTNGALYCENVKKFGVPAYIWRGMRAGRVRECGRAGDVVFWKETERK